MTYIKPLKLLKHSNNKSWRSRDHLVQATLTNDGFACLKQHLIHFYRIYCAPPIMTPILYGYRDV